LRGGFTRAQCDLDIITRAITTKVARWLIRILVSPRIRIRACSLVKVGMGPRSTTYITTRTNRARRSALTAIEIIAARAGARTCGSRNGAARADVADIVRTTRACQFGGDRVSVHVAEVDKSSSGRITRSEVYFGTAHGFVGLGGVSDEAESDTISTLGDALGAANSRASRNGDIRFGTTRDGNLNGDSAG